MNRSGEYRNRWALGLSVVSSLFIFISFAFYKGYISLGNDSGQIIAAEQKYSDQVASIVTPASPLQNTKETFEAAFNEINKQYQEFKDSLSNVFVPFISGIEIYERK